MQPSKSFIRLITLYLIVLFILGRSNIVYGTTKLHSIPAANYAIQELGNGQSSGLSTMGDGGHSFLDRYGPWIIVAAAGAPLFAADKDIKKYSQRGSLHSASADNFFKTVHFWGQGWEFAIAIPLFAGHGLIYKKNRSMVIAGELLAGLAIDGVATEAFKISLGRLRPFQSNSPFRFFKGGRSFFSGDVSTSVAFATIISKEFPSQNLGFLGINHKIPLAPFLLYSAAGLVACQRIYSNNHWASDVYYGTLAGYASGLLTVHLLKGAHLKGFTVAPGRPSMVITCFGIR